MRLFNLTKTRGLLAPGLVLMLSLQLMACSATQSTQKNSQVKAGATIVVGQTTQKHIRDQLGKPDELHTDIDQSEIWVYIYRVNIPFLVSLIPVVGDIADAVELAHKDRELIVQFNKDGIVKKYKVRSLDQ